MTTLENNFESLKSDLTYAWETKLFRIEDNILEDNPMNRMMEAANYINCIDPENMVFLKALFSKTNDSWATMNRLAKDVRKMSWDSFVKKHLA